MRPKSIAYLLAIFLSLLLAGLAQADPPARIGRISYVAGSVSFHSAGWPSESFPPDTQPNGAAQVQWAPAQLNYPITTGDALWADANGRLEVQVGLAEIRADHKTEITIVRLDDDMTLLRVDQGIVNVHVNTLANQRFAVMTPHGQIDLIKPGSYHIEVGDTNTNDRTPQMQITTLEGEAHINTARASLEILPGECAIISGDPINVTLVEGNATDFDDWALLRERREQDQIATRYVSSDMTGYVDLDRAGHWADDAEYGTVWYPAVAEEWAPYRYGHWAYIDPWGWTWIDNAPWGFAPFHYGRWVYVHHAWGWCPGERVVRPVYAPALVAFVGGAHWGVAVTDSAAPIGWIPLGPHEVYRPYYRASDNYVRNININHVDKTVITNITSNDVHENNFHNRNAVTVVSGETFTHGKTVFEKTLPVSRDAIATVQPLKNIDHTKPEHIVIDETRKPKSLDENRFPQVLTPVSQKNTREELNRMNNSNTKHSGNFENHSVQNSKVFDEKARLPTANNVAAAPSQTNFNNRENSDNHRVSVIAPVPPSHSEGPPHEDAHAHAPINLPHPQQNTQIRPTLQGWQRAPIQPVHSESHEEHRPASKEKKHRDRS